MFEDDCIHGLPYKAWCAICNGSLKKLEQESNEDAAIIDNLLSWGH